MLECQNCPYHYREFDWETKTYVNDYPCCHFVQLFEGDFAPCEYPEEDCDEYGE